ncbi:MAG: hypothetical protein JW703_04735 [Candidatus Diapherotrites archaeon]|nr:hypothetical protein [Candidatus Diapherotrites archaeon]
MNSQEIETELQKIKERNKKVELNKAWETSLTRKTLIAVLTYIVIVIFLIQIKNSEPFINAVVPTIGFILSTLAIEPVKKIWIKNKIK